MAQMAVAQHLRPALCGGRHRVGTEFRVNTARSDQHCSSVAALADGGFVVTWTSLRQDGSDYGIYGQRYMADGIAVGSEFIVNTFTTTTSTHPP